MDGAVEKEDNYNAHVKVKDVLISKSGGEERDDYVPAPQNDVNSLQTPTNNVSSTHSDEIPNTFEDLTCTKHTFEDEYAVPVISTLPTRCTVTQGQELVYGNAKSCETVDYDTPDVTSNYETSEIDRISEGAKVDSYVPCVSTEGSSEMWTFDDNDTRPPSGCSGISRGGQGNGLKEEPPDLTETDNEFGDFEDYCRSEFDECSFAVQEEDFATTSCVSMVGRASVRKKNRAEDVGKLRDESEVGESNSKSNDDLEATVNECSYNLKTSEFGDCGKVTDGPISGNQSDDAIPPDFCVSNCDVSDIKNVRAVIHEKTCTINAGSSKISLDSIPFHVQNHDGQLIKGKSVGQSYVSGNLGVSCSFGICTESEKSPDRKRDNIETSSGNHESVEHVLENCNIQDEDSSDNLCSFDDKLELSSVENLSRQVADTSDKLNEEMQSYFVKNRLEVDGKDGFGDFDGYIQPARENDDPRDEMPDLPKEDEFGDFVTPQHNADDLTIEVDPEVPVAGTDEFADFESHVVPFHAFSSVRSDSIKSLLGCKDIVGKVEKIIVDMYPEIDNDIGEFTYEDLIDGDVVYDQVKNIVETNALNYQWAKSSGQDRLLKALNIDTRNIVSVMLYTCGPCNFSR